MGPSIQPINAKQILCFTFFRLRDEEDEEVVVFFKEFKLSILTFVLYRSVDVLRHTKE